MHANILVDPRTTWQNYHQNFNKKIRGIYLVVNGTQGDAVQKYSESTRAIQELLGDARDGVNTQNAHTLRAYGSAWSMSEIAHCQGFLVNNKNLTIHFPITKDHVDPAFQGDPQSPNVHCFQAGTTIKAASAVLDARQQSIKTSGASDGQTIAGALSTGTHGSALDFGSIQESVVALHVAVGPDRTVWLERASRPVVKAAVVNNAPFHAELLRDDALFDAAVVGLGAFGVILSVTIEVEPRYLLEVFGKRIPFDGAVRAAIGQFDFTGVNVGHPAERPHHFSIIVNPHKADEVYATIMYKRPYVANYPKHDFADPDSGLGDDALEFIGRAIDFFPQLTNAMIPTIVTNTLTDRYETIDGAMGTHREVFCPTSIRGKVSSTAIGLPRASSAAVLDEVLALHAAGDPFPGGFGMRFVKGTNATLGFTRYPSTCVLEADAVDCEAASSFHQRLWNMLAAKGIDHTIHWGKVNNLTKQRVRAMYGDRVDAWIAARNRLLDPGMRAVFSNPFLDRAGLTGA
jgi:FAD/FMN-containing dehydrogenase